jgi:hypothetical protein
MESMKKISLIAVACSLIYTGCLVNSKADVGSKIDSLGLSSKLITQLDTLNGKIYSPSFEKSRCNIIGASSEKGNRFFLGKLPESAISSNYNFRVNLSDSISNSNTKSNIHSFLNNSNFKLEFSVDSSYSDIPKKIKLEYKRVNTTIFGNDTFSVSTLNLNVLNFFKAPKTWSDSLKSNGIFVNSSEIITTANTLEVQDTEKVSTKPSKFFIKMPEELIEELKSKKTETLIYDFRITNLDENTNYWLFSKNSLNHSPIIHLENEKRELLHHGECLTNEESKPFLTSLTNDTLNLKFSIVEPLTSKNLIRSAWLLVNDSTFTSAAEDSIVESSVFYNTSKIFSNDTSLFQESSLDTLSKSRFDLVSNKDDLSLPITSVVDHAAALTTTAMEKEIRFALRTNSIDAKYYYNNLAWFQLNSESVPVKIVVERLVEEIE